MPIPLPNLDDRSYHDLTAEARALIPSLYPQWTHHNPSDPGIVLIELLAWLTEMLMYQMNEVPDRHIETFLKLLGWNEAERHDVDLDTAIRDTLVALRRQHRAVTAEDFERLTLEQWPQSAAAQAFGASGRIKRVRCVARRNLAAADPVVRNSPAPAHVSVVIIPDTPDPYLPPPEALRHALYEFLKTRCLLTTRAQVVGPDYVAVEISATVIVHEDALPRTTADSVTEALSAFFDPLRGGPERRGWPFGRDVYASEIYAVLETVAQVDYAEDVLLSAPRHEGRVQKEGNTVVGITLDAHESVIPEKIKLVAIDVYGQRHEHNTVGGPRTLK